MDSIEPNDTKDTKSIEIDAASNVVVDDINMTADPKPKIDLFEPVEEDTPEPKPTPEVTPEPTPEPTPEVTQVFVIEDSKAEPTHNVEEIEPSPVSNLHIEVHTTVDANERNESNVQSETEDRGDRKTESFETIAITSVTSLDSPSNAAAEASTSASAPTTPSPLTDLFVSILKAQNSDLKLNLNLNLTLDKQTIDCLLFILNSHPDYFSDFGKLISLILEDGKINLADVPYISLLVSKTYEFIHHFKKNVKHMNNEKTFEVCANIMKTVFHVLITKNVIVIQVDVNKEVLMTTFDSVVDSCVNLVKLNHVLNKKGCCLSFFTSKSSKAESNAKASPPSE